MSAVAGTVETGGFYEEPITSTASADVHAFVRGRGGTLYVWTTVHHSPRTTITLLQTATTCPEGRPTPGFVRFGAGDFDLYLDPGGRGWPDEIVLELIRWRRLVRAYWNNHAYLF